MSSTVEDQAQNLAVNKLGFSETDFKIAWDAGVLLVILATGNIALAKFLDLDLFSGSKDPKIKTIIDWLKKFELELTEIKTAVQVGDYNATYNSVITKNAAVIDGAMSPISTFRHTPSPANRDGLKTTTGALHDAMLAVLRPEFPFGAMVYSGPEWAEGRLAYFRYYIGEGSWPGWYKFQVYEQVLGLSDTKPLETEWALPEPLHTEPLLLPEYHWDGLPSLPVVLFGLPVWQAALTLLEPFYRLTNQWRDYIKAMSAAMEKFSGEWERLLLWTREMPSLPKIVKEMMTPPGLIGGVVGGGSYAPTDFPDVGFPEWPCGALDPVMGVEIINKDKPWWTSDGWPSWSGGLEMMTDKQRTEFTQLRDFQLVKLKAENHFNDFKYIRLALNNLLIPPSVSPSLAVHPEHVRVTRPSGRIQPKFENVKDLGGTVWIGSVVQSSVSVRVPISVQPNPAPGAPPGNPLPARRAESEIVFGYQITVTPVGGTPKTLPMWNWPLNGAPEVPKSTDSQYSDLYHDKSGEIQTVPYARSHTFSEAFYEASALNALTWKTVTDGQRRDRIDKAEGVVVFTMTVTVYDQQYSTDPDGVFPLDLSDPDQRLWHSQHGVIGITIEADMNENKGRSFEIIIEVTETARVDKMGRRTGETDFAGLKTYSRKCSMPVDIYRIKVPKGYFDWMRPFLERLRHVSQRMNIPHPEPDHDPVLELSLWRIVLERNPVLLQAHVHELQRISGRPFLMPHEALAEIDAAVNTLIGLRRDAMLMDAV
jgi:hypothetical protein